MLNLKKKVNLRLQDCDGNAFFLMGAFSRQAKKEKWTREEIEQVMDECRSGDYDHLLQTLIAHTEDRDDQYEEDHGD